MLEGLREIRNVRVLSVHRRHKGQACAAVAPSPLFQRAPCTHRVANHRTNIRSVPPLRRHVMINLIRVIVEDLQIKLDVATGCATFASSQGEIYTTCKPCQAYRPASAGAGAGRPGCGWRKRHYQGPGELRPQLRLPRIRHPPVGVWGPRPGARGTAPASGWRWGGWGCFPGCCSSLRHAPGTADQQKSKCTSGDKLPASPMIPLAARGGNRQHAPRRSLGRLADFAAHVFHMDARIHPALAQLRDPLSAPIPTALS